MSYQPPPTWQPMPGPTEVEPAAPRARRRWAPREDLRAGAVIIGILAVVGALLGILWQWWSPPGGLGYVVAPGAIQADETENWIAADGRFALICAVVGVLAAVVVWRLRRTRGPVVAAALGVGGLIGALLTAWVGSLVGGGSDKGPASTLLHELPLRVRMHGLLLLEAALAVLLYSVFASFAVQDDLGRPESSETPPVETPPVEAQPVEAQPVEAQPVEAQPTRASVPMGGELEDGRGDGDAAGGL
jgi:Protein of unknown function (DUF2567)